MLALETDKVVEVPEHIGLTLADAVIAIGVTSTVKLSIKKSISAAPLVAPSNALKAKRTV